MPGAGNKKTMAKDEIRPVKELPAELTAQILEQQKKARKQLPNEIHQAVVNIHAAWKLLPAPKFGNNLSESLVLDCIYILNFALKHEDARQLLERWIKDLESSGYRSDNALPYLLMGETLLFLEQPKEAQPSFRKALEIGGREAFDNKPVLYLDIASEKLTDDEQIKADFEQLDLLEVWFKQEELSSSRHTMSKEMLAEIDRISEEGSELFDEGKYRQAISAWEKAFAFVPDPKNTFSQSLWLHSSIGDAWFLLKDFKQSAAHFFAAKSNVEENGYANPFIMLRLGQSYLELSDAANAKEYLLRAYALEGKELFNDEDPKYFDFLSKNVKL